MAIPIRAVAVFFLAASPPWYEQAVQESAAAGKACAAKQYEECRKDYTNLYQLLDGGADVAYRLAKVEAALGNRGAALHWLTLFSQSGLTLADPSTEADFAALRDAPEFQAAIAKIAQSRQPVDTSQLKFRLREADLIAEDVAFDPKSERFFVSSVRYGSVVSIDHDGVESDFVKPGPANLWAMLALQVDARRRILWATTAAIPEFGGYRAADAGKSALLEIALDSGKITHRFDVTEPGKHALGDMTLAPDGTVYVSDESGAVYRLTPKGKALEVLIESGTFHSPQNPACAGDRLFVADYSRGIGIMDLKTKQTALLAHPPDLSLAGIDGMYLNGNVLIAIQNGTKPERIIRINLDSTRTRAESWKIIEANAPELGSPTHGVMFNGRFFFIAQSGWDNMGDDGKPKPGAAFTAPEVRFFDLRD